MCSYKCCFNNVIDPKKTRELSVLLKLLSDNNRLQLLSILQKGEHCVCELLSHTKLPQSLVSHHLRDLKDHGLVLDRKEGKWSYYSLTPKAQKITNLIFKIQI